MARGRTPEDVYRLYMNDLYRYLTRLTGNPRTAEDLVQETFIRAHIHLDSIRLCVVGETALWNWSPRSYHSTVR